MKLLRTIFFVTAVAVAIAVTPVALASSPSPAELKALEIRGQELNQACLDPTQSHAPGVCTYTARRYKSIHAELKALEIRGQALNQACLDPTHSQAAFRALCTYTGTQTHPTRVEASSSGFDWADFSIGAGAMLGLALLLGGTAAGLHFGRRGAVRPRTVS